MKLILRSCKKTELLAVNCIRPSKSNTKLSKYTVVML